MMDHAAFRRALLADPNASSSELDVHREGCAECRQFAERLGQFEAQLGRALRIDVTTRAARRAPARRWLALAASFAGALLAGGLLWLAQPRTGLAADVVRHMAGELGAWNTVDPVAAAASAAALEAAGVTLQPAAGAVSYASRCEFRGFVVPHLVVQSGSGPVTVMVLVHERVSAEERFEENGYRGRLLPVPGHGSIAVLEQPGRTPALDVDAVAAQVRAALVYPP